MRNRLHEILHRERPSNDDLPLRVVGMDEDEAVELFETLGSETTYRIYRQLHEEPKVPRELATALDSTIQNIHYHLNKLEEADLIQPVDTWHSENGVEMKVYVPVHDPLVISFGSHEDQDQIQTLLSRVFGLLGGVSLISLIAEFIAASATSSDTTGSDVIAESSKSPASGEPHTLFDNLVGVVLQSDPGVVLFLLGVTILSVSTALYLARREPSVR
ncbi:hypothetical protein Hbor_33200 (plasmid) [Halogeometricum borinquense DSM 11551]|uniref:HVO-1552 C-terminal domain-containing protein n=2 Tax=Halogeometricum borinquense (strain ATCC 700274 / DSM 11551 / JCM 10706 / KCTC 4070 / PR3) TaxID=469382 RepID=E4NVG1_HALBP|nr:hypothetical protein Hbor_33200 [Halogeometricum borinquense DSM 11551]